MNANDNDDALERYMRAGRENSRLSIMFRSAIAARAGLNVTDMECLDFLMDCRSATAGELAEQINLTTGAVTAMIRRLEKAGYIKATRDPADRRRVIVTPVAARLRLGEALYASYRRDVEHAIAGHTPDQLLFLENHYRTMSDVYLQQLDKLRRDSH